MRGFYAATARASSRHTYFTELRASSLKALVSCVVKDMLEVQFRSGVFLPQFDWWLDPHHSKPRAFVSHAHADHFAAHREILCSPFTAQLITARYPGARTILAPAFGEIVPFENHTVTLLPSGHILGAAQFFLESDGGSLLYTGDFKVRAGVSSEALEWRKSDTLIMETTYGLPRFVFPPAEQVIASVVRFCRETLDAAALPVLIGYSLGKAQEIQAFLAQNGLRVVLHEAVYKMASVYHECAPDFPAPIRFDPNDTAGVVLICPPAVARSRWLKSLGPVRTAMLTGWAMTPGAERRYNVDAAFPLSDHADFTDLLHYVTLVQPKRVLTLHGYAAEFAAHLRSLGIEAWALSADDQLELALPSTRVAVSIINEMEPLPDSEFGRFCALCALVEMHPARLEKIAALADWFRSAEPDSLPWAARWLAGTPMGPGGGRNLQTGWALVRRALLEATGRSEAELKEISRRQNEAGLTSEEFLRGHTEPQRCDIQTVASLIGSMASSKGQGARIARLAEWFKRATAGEGKWLVKLLLGDLRIGLREGLVEEGIAVAFGRDAEMVRDAHMITGDPGEVANRARLDTLAEVAPMLFRPLRCMLASPLEHADAVWERLSSIEHGVWSEPKFDGIRLQVHADGSRVELYSRDLNRVTQQFAELARAFEGGPRVILDGELVAWGESGVLPFAELQKRLGRKEEDLFLQQNAPLRYVVFDLLWQDGSSLLNEPLTLRRDRLEAVKLPEMATLVEVTRCEKVDAIRAAFLAAKREKTEGLICKDPASAYRPGRRGLHWFKLKVEFGTLDVVVVAVEQGHGKRRDLLSDYTFAIRDEKTGELLVIGKAYSGLTDKEITTLGERFRAETLREKGRKLFVQPVVVLEVAFDAIQPSQRHSSGLALRFPRIKRIREDKTAAEIDTLRTARNLAGLEN